jgi:DNA helicase-2/ATP-dependent DNA helicase PcrA
VAQSFLTPPLPSDDVSVPVRIPASSLERLVLNPAAFREALARPTPQKPHRAALRGTLFHRFVEERFDTAVPGPFLHEGEGNTVEDDALSLEEWKAAFAASEFASLAPLAIEAELHLPVGPHIVICKIDAVFPGARGVHIVDWKTGKAPGSDEELAAKALQLAAYRLAWSKWSATPLEQIEASFWYAEGSTLVTPSDLPGAEEFEKLILEALRF